MRAAVEARRLDTWLITGGAGFIGCHFVRRALARSGVRTVVLDKLTYAGNLQSLADVADDPHFVFVQRDIADADGVEAVFREHRPAVVVNFAAESHVDRSIDGPRDFVVTNVQGCFELLEASRRHLATLSPAERERFRFLHVSTDEVYGALGPLGAFSEATPHAPNSPYAASKASAEHFVRAYHATFGVPTLLTNCSNNYGPYQFPEKLIPLTILNAVEGKPLPVYGDGLYVRDWLHVEDHVDAILAALDRGAPGGKYNVGGDNERSNLEIVDRICDALEQLRPAKDNAALSARGIGSYRDLKTFVADRAGHDRRYAIDASKIKSELGWAPRRPFEKGLRDTVLWYLDHRDWVTAVQDKARYERERLGLSGAPGARP
jgi:dTDP-glucose 4,6-dehydratase